tara:strand:- start:503 stop:778 length:276 start_codon:yes stop_codon:yes gene_type:complete
MKNILSNRFFQGGIAIAVIGIAFFAYQNTGDSTVETASTETTEEVSAESATAGTTTTTQTPAINGDQIENAVNNTAETDNITNNEEDATTE